MSKFMKQEIQNQDQQIKDLMITIRRNTQCSKCIDNFENLLNEVEDKEFVDTVIIDVNRFITEFSRLCKEVDNMKNLDYIARVLTYDFIQPYKYFRKSHKMTELYLLMNDMLQKNYQHAVYDIDKHIVLPNNNFLGNIYHKETFTNDNVAMVAEHFGITGLSAKQVKERKEVARKVILLYNYLPAIVKALVQTKRRKLNLDKNSKMFE